MNRIKQQENYDNYDRFQYVKMRPFSPRTTKGTTMKAKSLGRLLRCHWIITIILLWHIAGVAASSSSLLDAPTTVSSSSVPKTTSASSASSAPQSTQKTMGSPESIKLRPRVISLNIMVAGLAGLGKTTTVRALLDAWTWQEIHEEHQRNERKKNNEIKNMAHHPDRRGGFFSSLSSVVASSLSSSSSSASTASKAPGATPPLRQSAPAAFGSTTAIVPSAPFEYYDPDANTILRVRIIDTPGFGNRVNHKNSVQPITDYITECRSARFRREQSPSVTAVTAAAATTRGTGVAAGKVATVAGDDPSEEDELIHVCLYFLSPGRFLAIDRHFLKHVQDEITIVPVIAKADTMTDSEIARYRAELEQIWKDESIDVYSLDDHYSPSSAGGAKRTRTISKSRPSNGDHKDSKFHRGRRSGEVLAIVSRDGIYPWGHSSALDLEHSDLVLIRDSLLSEHTERFLQLANQKYSAYRNRRLANHSRSDRLKYFALVGLAAVQLGRVEVAGTTLHAVASRCASAVARVPVVQGLIRALVARARFVRRLALDTTSLGMGGTTDGDSNSNENPNDPDDENIEAVPDQDGSKPKRGLIFGFFGTPSRD